MIKLLFISIFYFSISLAWSYDQDLAYERVSQIFCGEPIGYTQLNSFKAKNTTDKKTDIDNLLSTCLSSSYWKNKALHRIADHKIKPIDALGTNAQLYILGDYKFDYRLYSYLMSDNRDMRQLLLADFHIDTNGNRVNGEIPVTNVPGKIINANGQPLVVSKRAGMLTTQWFIGANTMFSELPRNAASQAYRAYLGYDIALSEGLIQVANEPRDVDQIGINKPMCASCHTTLDPLSYPFSPYQGLEAGNDVGTYLQNRTSWSEQGHILGNSVADLKEWVGIAANSDQFKKKMTKDLFVFIQGSRELNSEEEVVFNALWPQLPSLNYSANAVIKKIVEAETFTSVPTWKRSHQLFSNIKSALELPDNLVCVELNNFDCINDLFLFSLGGNDPFFFQQYERAKNINLFSVSNFERVVLSACSNSVELDFTNTPKKVFKHFSLTDLTMNITENNYILQVQELYRRLLNREAISAEIEEFKIFKNLDQIKSKSGAELNKATCFMIGTQIEFSFY